jgi:DNA invertase Pin-like site-specific DNA recombinase
MLQVVTVMTDRRQRQGGFRSLCDGALDTTTAPGALVLHLFAARAQCERRLMQERTRAGRAAARARGKPGGRHALRADAPQVRMADTLARDPRLTGAAICAYLGLARATFYRSGTLAWQEMEDTRR